MKQLLFYATLSLLILHPALGHAQSNEKHDSDQAKITALEHEVTQLREEVSQLKTEIQQLRRLLATQPTSVASPKSSGEFFRAPQQDNNTDSGYWCTKSSNKRHNPSCRYYKTSNGRPCGPNDGIA